jgi:F420-dependent oxidoreductase-like protein
MGSVSGEPGPTDAWTTLAGLARETKTIRLGTLVTSATFRLPGPLAVTVAQVDAMSGGRVELGLGAGWFTDEHEAYGIPFPDVGERFDRLTEQFAVITGLWSTPPGETFSFTGRHYTLKNSPALPKPVQSPIPVIVGGRAKRRTAELAAKYAGEFNAPFRAVDEFGPMCDSVRKACESIDRDPASLTYSAAMVVCVGADEADFARRAKAIGREPGELREQGAAGTPAETVATLKRWADAGAERAYLQVLDLSDLEHLDLIAAEVAPHVS